MLQTPAVTVRQLALVCTAADVGIAPYETFRDFEFMFCDFGFCHLVDRKFRDRKCPNISFLKHE